MAKTRSQRQGHYGRHIAYAFWKNCGDLIFLETITSLVVLPAPQISHSLIELASSEPAPSAHPNHFQALQTEAVADDEDEVYEDNKDNDNNEDDKTNEESSEIPPKK